MIPKGTEVRVRTTNGGDTVAVLERDYHPTYDVVILLNRGWLVIPAFRLQSVERVEATNG